MDCTPVTKKAGPLLTLPFIIERWTFISISSLCTEVEQEVEP